MVDTETIDVLVVDRNEERLSQILTTLEINKLNIHSTNIFEEAFGYINDNRYQTILLYAGDPEILKLIDGIVKSERNSKAQLIIYAEREEPIAADVALKGLEQKGIISYLRIENSNIYPSAVQELVDAVIGSPEPKIRIYEKPSTLCSSDIINATREDVLNGDTKEIANTANPNSTKE